MQIASTGSTGSIIFSRYPPPPTPHPHTHYAPTPHTLILYARSLVYCRIYWCKTKTLLKLRGCTDKPGICCSHPSVKRTLNHHRFNVNSTSITVETTLFKRCEPAIFFLFFFVKAKVCIMRQLYIWLVRLLSLPHVYVIKQIFNNFVTYLNRLLWLQTP